MSFPLKIVGLIKSKTPVTSGILVTMTPTASFTPGINLTFASGTLTIDWKDGSATENFVSGTELTHTYTTASTYIAEITGDLTNITKFIADNSRITSISNLQTGLLTDFRINDNLYTGSIDMSNSPVSGLVYLYDNSGLTGVTFASSGNAKTTSLLIDDCNLSTLDLSNVPIGGIFQIHNNSSLSSITFASSGNTQITSCRIDGCNITGTLDLSNVPMSTTLTVQNNSSLTGITFASSGNGKFTSFTFSGCDITGTLDLSNMPVSGTLNGGNNSNLTGVTFASSGNTVFTNLTLNKCNITGTLDLSNNPIGGIVSLGDNILMTGVTFANSGNNSCFIFVVEGSNITGTLDLSNVPISGAFDAGQNALLTNITFASSGNGSLSVNRFDNCTMTNVDFSVFSNSDGLTINANNNSFTSTEHDNQLINLDNTGWINGSLTITAGNTARTSASDAAYNNLTITNGWAIT